MNQLIDNYGRRIDYLRLSVTDRCNLRCIYCMPKKGIKLLDRRELLSFGEILRVIKILSGLGIKKIRFTGGEPLLRDNLLELLRDISNIPEIEDLAITTNGVLLGGYLKDIYKVGIRRINISVDSMDPEKYKMITRGGDIRIVLEAIKNSIKMGFKSVKINVVITGHLDRKDSLDFIRFALENPVSVRFIEMMPVSDPGTIECSSSSYNYTGRIKTGVKNILEYMRGFGKVIEMKEPIIYGPAIYYRVDGTKGRIGFIENKKGACLYCNRIRLTPKGTVRSCLFSGRELNIKEELRNSSDDMKIREMLIDFIREKPKDRSYNNGHGIENELRISGSMNRIGG